MSPKTLLGTGLVLVFVSSNAVDAQGTRADYERADRLRGTTRDKVFRTRVQPQWFADGERFWYRVDTGPGQREYVLVNAAAGKRELAFDHARLATALAAASGQPAAADKLDLESLDFDADGKTLRFKARGKVWRCDLEKYEIRDNAASEKEARRPDADTESNGAVVVDAAVDAAVSPLVASSNGSAAAIAPDPEPRRAGAKSPDGKWTAVIKDHDLWIQATEGGAEYRLTNDGKHEDGFGHIHWSPDSSRIIALRTAAAQRHTVHMVESSPKDQVQPKLHSHNYLKPGDRVTVSKPHLFDVAAHKEIPVSDELFENPYRISHHRWELDGRRFTFLYNQRGHQVLRLVAIDTTTGEVGVIIDEQSKTFVDYAFKTFLHRIDATSEIIWMSERDGWNHLWLIDSRTGDVKNQITRGEWVVRKVDRVDNDKRQVWFRASGIYPEQDPYYVHYCRIDFDGSNLLALTNGNGTHDIKYSPNRRYIVDTYSRVDMAPVTELRRVDDGGLVCVLERGDFSALVATGSRVPERFVAKGRDGKTDIHGIILRPTNFDPGREYPVIEKIYAGPHGSHVPKSFRSFHRAQSLAELGFVVVQIDGMGTSNRSKAFHDVCWRNLRDAGFPDRILWMQAAAKKYPYLDLDRVGIFGGSAGGQNTLAALLFHPEFYKVGVSDCGCHDNRMDKIWWNEAWMGWPVGPWYAENSNVTHANKLQGKLLLTVGELDRNVDPASTMQVVNALIKANKDFDFVLVPGAGHGIGESPYLVRRRRDFFVRHLHGVEPRRQETTRTAATEGPSS